MNDGFSEFFGARRAAFVAQGYLAPPALLLWRSFGDGSGAFTLLMPVLVMAAGQLAGGLAWLAISGEDSPDLVASAPVPAAEIVRAKIEAVMGAIAAVFAPFVVALALVSYWHALVSAIGVLNRGMGIIDKAILNAPPRLCKTRPVFTRQWHDAKAGHALFTRRKLFLGMLLIAILADSTVVFRPETGLQLLGASPLGEKQSSEKNYNAYKKSDDDNPDIRIHVRRLQSSLFQID